jgi:hypothetical protein
VSDEDYDVLSDGLSDAAIGSDSGDNAKIGRGMARIIALVR